VNAITSDNRRWWVLATMTGALSMLMIDQTVVSVALPTMQRDLALSASGVQWVVNAYLLALAVLVALGGRAGDIFGPERVFRIGLVTFVGASAACGLANGETWIIAARAIQGIGGAFMIPATGAIVINAFAPRERGRAMGIYAGASMVFLALGPLVGGLLTQGVSWRAVFYLNLPIGLATLALAHVVMPRAEAARPQGGSIDWLGSALLVTGLGSLVLALMQGQTWGWHSTAVVGLLSAAAVIAPVFVWWELRCDQPLVKLALFRRGNFGIDNVILAGVQFALVGVSVFGAIWVQDVLGFGPIEAGLSLLPLTLPLLVAAPLAGRVFDRIGPRAPLAAGALLLALSLAWLALALHHLSYPWLIPGYIAMGAALGCVISPASTDAMNAAAPSERSQASGLTQMMRQVGGAIGIAVLGAVVASTERAKIAAAGGPSPDVLRSAATAATAHAYWLAAAVMLAVALGAAACVRLRVAADAETAPAATGLARA
jgi:EmrB/QacA subfamily drug resistance transporter